MAAAVLLAHLALLGGALRLTVWRDRVPPARPAPPLVVMLLQPRATPPRAPAALPLPPKVARPPAVRLEPQAITLPAPEVPAAPATPAAVAAEAPASAPPPLDLRLPRSPFGTSARRNPALDDPRSNSARPATVEGRIASLLGGVDGIVEERLADGVMRFRRGKSCVLVWPNRAERIDPFNASAFPKMKGVEGC